MSDLSFMRGLTTSLASAAIFVGFGLSLPAAAAVQTCTANSVAYSLGSASDKLCVSSANDTNTIDSSYLMLGMTGWVLADKSNDNTSGDGSILFTDAPTSGEASPGTWAISADAFSTGSSVVVTLKQGNSFAAFLLDSIGGTWTTAGPGGSRMGLSHASIYYQPAAPIPLPAAAWLLLGGLGGLGLVARRRKAA